MNIISEKEEDGVIARRFDLTVGDEVVPGMHWIPANAGDTYPTVCIGHGGLQHKRYRNVPELALQLVQNLGVGVVALDAPGHGDRFEGGEEAADKARAEGTFNIGRRSRDPEAMKAYAARMQMHVEEWKAMLDELQEDERWAAGPFGWWGVSMGTSHGLPLAAQDGRISAAVFGLNALAPTNTTMKEQAESLTIPILFLIQRDDELMTIEAALALWDAFGSKEKTMHLNPGGHVQVPKFERDSSEAFFRRHLLPED